MAKVHLDLLNKRQLHNLKAKNKAWVISGLIPDDGQFYHHCNRCEELKIGLRYKPIEAFSFRGSRSDGCSVYCTECLDNRLSKEEAHQCVELMREAGIEPKDSILLLQDADGTWKPAKQFNDPSAQLRKCINRQKANSSVVPPPSEEKRSFFEKVLALFS